VSVNMYHKTKNNGLARLNSDYNFLGKASASARSKNNVYCEALTVLIERLRALKWLAWNAHWMASGPTSYSDHLLFERIYASIDKHVDTVAENLFGSNPGLTKASWTLGVQHNVTDYLEGILSIPKDSISSKEVLTALRDVHRACQDVVDLKTNLAAEDFAPAIAKKMETYIYLLQQRGA
jgi:DNA-binding ferritin-like protein